VVPERQTVVVLAATGHFGGASAGAFSMSRSGWWSPRATPRAARFAAELEALSGGAWT
jgi:hypothetical protein